MCRSILPDSKPKAAQVMEREENDKLVLYLGHALIVLGAYEAEIWQMLDGEHTIESIARMVVDKYNLPEERVIHEITVFLNQLFERNLIIY